MKVLLQSRNRKLERLCRELVSALPEGSLEWAPGAGPAPQADLLIRDVEESDAGPLPVLEPAREPDALFLVEAEQAAEFARKLAGSASAVLVKPVRRAALGRWLERAAARRRSAPAAAGADPHRPERDELLQCLLLASLRLQQSSEDRTNFLARALHDFRAPLTAASGYCTLLLEQAIGTLNRNQFDILERMQHSLERLSKMAKMMFQLSMGRLEEAETSREEGDIVAVLEQAVYEIGPPAEARGIELSVRADRPPERLWFDTAQIEQVLGNLLENACKFTPSGGAIEVRGYPTHWLFAGSGLPGSVGEPFRPEAAGAESNAYRIDVSDSGPGVPTERLGRIFEQSVTYSGSQDRSGTGLGLATCRMIVAAHGGEIFVDSRGQGATFSFVLPFIRWETRDETEGSGAGTEVRASVSRESVRTGSK